MRASANFPPVFTPFKIFNLYDGERYESLALTDGGVHDNQGVETLLEAACTHIIVSDAGGVVRPEYRPADARIPMMDRVIDLLMGGVRRAILRTLERTVDLSQLAAEMAAAQYANRDLTFVRENTPLQRAAIFHMSANVSEGAPNGLPPFAPMEVAQIRTDLDRFNPLEIAALRHQGYQLADRYARCFADEKTFGEPTQPIADLQSPAPELSLHPTRKQRKVLRGGALLFGRFSAAYPVYSAALAFFVAVALFYFCHGRLMTVEKIHSLYQQEDLTRYLSSGKTAPISSLSALFSDFLLKRTGKVSVLGLPFLLWAFVVAIQEAIRAYRNRTKDEITSVNREVWKDRLRWMFALLKRPWNLLTIGSVIAFALTLHANWLILFVPFWSLFIAAVFFVIHWAFTPLWCLAGHLQTPPTDESALRSRDSMPLEGT